MSLLLVAWPAACVCSQDSLQQRASQVAGLQTDVKARNQFADQMWSEVRAARIVLSQLTSPAQGSHGSPGLAGSPGLRAHGLLGPDSANEASTLPMLLDWSSVRSQDHAVRAASELRAQVRLKEAGSRLCQAMFTEFSAHSM